VSQRSEISLKAINERKDNYMILCSVERKRSAEMLSEENIMRLQIGGRRKVHSDRHDFFLI